MDWNTFYTQNDEWSKSEILSSLALLENIGPAEQVGYFLDNNYDIPGLEQKLIQRAHDLGVSFDANQVLEMGSALSQDVLLDLIRRVYSSGSSFSCEQIEQMADFAEEPTMSEVVHLALGHGMVLKPVQIQSICNWVSDETAGEIIDYHLKKGVKFTPKQIMDLYGYVDEQTMCTIVKSAMENGVVFSPKQLMDFYGVVDEQTMCKMVHHAMENGVAFTLKQILFCPFGRIQLILENQRGREEIELSDPSVGVVIEEPTWREMLWLQKDSVLCVAASDYYDPMDYVRDHDEYRRMISNKEKD